MATSTDTEPESDKNTLVSPAGVSSTSFSQSVTAGEWVQIGEGMREFYAAKTFIWVCANLARKPSGGSAAQILAGVQNRALFSDAP